jgi:eukaryotic-like serine/threonine-protein kinase
MKLMHVLTSKQFFAFMGGLIIIGAIAFVALDKWIMPWYTNYNEGVTVPDVTKIPIDDAERMLEMYGLRHVVIDRRPHEAFPANYIIDQTPAGTSIVKPNRTIYLTVSSSDRPMVSVPEVVNLSLNNAQIQLQNHGLRVGNVTFESSRFRNAVLRQSIPGGRSVDRGTIIDLVVSDGLGQQRVEIPDIVGLRLAEGQRLLREVGLRVGTIQFRPTNQFEPNHIIMYSPNDSPTVFEGQALNLIVSEQLTVREESEGGIILDLETDALNSLRTDTLRPTIPDNE